MSKEREILKDNDVISVFEQNRGKFASGDTLKVLQLLAEYEGYITNSEVFLQGMECEVLMQNSEYQGWRKGKIKFVVQFEPEEVENENSPNSLADIRKQIDNTN